MNIDIWALLWLQIDLSNHLKGQLGPTVSDVTFLLLMGALKHFNGPGPVGHHVFSATGQFGPNYPILSFGRQSAQKIGWA